MLVKKNQDLPFGFHPTKKQKERLRDGCVVRKCLLCNRYFTTYPEKKQGLCMSCYQKCKGQAPIIFGEDF